MASSLSFGFTVAVFLVVLGFLVVATVAFVVVLLTGRLVCSFGLGLGVVVVVRLVVVVATVVVVLCVVVLCVVVVLAGVVVFGVVVVLTAVAFLPAIRIIF